MATRIWRCSVSMLRNPGTPPFDRRELPRTPEPTMPVQDLDPRTALVLIDLQKGITAMPTVESGDLIVERAARLARAFRDRGLPVVRVRVAFSPDGGDVLRARVD